MCDARSAIFVVCSVLFVVLMCCSLLAFVVDCYVGGRLLLVLCRMLCGVRCCLLFVVCCSLFVVRCSLFVVRCSLFGVGCLSLVCCCFVFLLFMYAVCYVQVVLKEFVV